MDAMADSNAGRVDDDTDLETRLINKALGDELRGLRNKRGLNQDELAEASGISKRTIIRLEQGERPMTTAQMYRLCRALGIRPSQLLDAAMKEAGIE